MKVTYLGHSGFCVEFDDVCLVFDYYVGEIPVNEANRGKKWLFLASHNHGDHFNEQVLEIVEQGVDVTYVFARDIRRKLRNREELMSGRDVRFVKFDETLIYENVEITTLQSTDQGVAFVVKIDGKILYHAGDLNWWHWDGESLQFNNNMAARFKKEISKLDGICGSRVDVAFVPLDPRQENAYYMGMKYFLENVRTGHVFPMHFWEKYDVQEQFVKEYGDVIEANGCMFHKLEYFGEQVVLGGI